MDEATEEALRSLYRHLINDFSGSQACRTIIASKPVEFDDAAGNGTLAELSAFLGPSRVDIPPLRSRIEDLKALIRFFALSRELKDPTERFEREAIEELQAYHWPGNVEELEMVTAFVLKIRPSGPIRREDLPETVRRPFGADQGTLHVLDEIAVQSKFRALRTNEGRNRLAIFLSELKGKDFRAGDIQILFGMGRETARRLLLSLESRGLVEALRGAKERRTTRYRTSNRE
jgi:DNA-binding NtrC family response regulator